MREDLEGSPDSKAGQTAVPNAPSQESASAALPHPTQGQAFDPPSANDAELEELDPDEMTDWKEALRDRFEDWLAELDSPPASSDETLDSEDAPDLYSFFEQLAVANAESRKSNRRAAEAFRQWGETLAAFQGQLGPLQDKIAELAVKQPGESQLPRAYCLVLIEFLDRLQRIAKAFQNRPVKSSWWVRNDQAWRELWNRQEQGFSILVGHLEALLEKEGVTRIRAMGQRFDPAEMTAVATEPERGASGQTVVEEITPGYRRGSELLRTAHVKVRVPV